MTKKIDNELKHLRPFRIAYELALCDNHLAKLLERFYLVHFHLMKQWGEFNPHTFSFGGGGSGGSAPNLFCFFPENFLTDVIECFTELVKTHPREHRVLMNETIISIYEFCLILLRTESSSITNPYTKAKALELMTIFIYSDSRKKELTNEFAKSEIINRCLMETVIRFYVEIEFAG